MIRSQLTGTGNIQGLGSLRNLVLGHVLVGVRKVGHLLEWHDFNAELVPVLLNKVLSVVWAVEVDTLAVLAGTSVVTANNEVSCTVVLADDGVPERLTRTSHTHGEGQQTQNGHAVGVAGKKSLVDADTGEVINVTGLGKTDDGVDEHVGLSAAGGTDSELTVGAVHWVAGLESDDLGPAKLVEVQTELCGRVAESDVVVVHQTVDSVELTTDVVVASGVEEVLDGRVCVVAVLVENLASLLLLVGLVDIVDGHDGQVPVISEVTQSDAGAGLDAEGVNGLLVQVEVDGYGEEVAVSQTVVLNNAIVILLVHETLKWGEATIEDQLQIAELALVQDDSGKLLGLRDELLPARSIAGEQVLELTACVVSISVLM